MNGKGHEPSQAENCSARALAWASSARTHYILEIREALEIQKLLNLCYVFAQKSVTQNSNTYSQTWQIKMFTFAKVQTNFTCLHWKKCFTGAVLLTFLWTSIKYSGFLNTLNTFDSNSKITSFFCRFFSRFLFSSDK